MADENEEGGAGDTPKPRGSVPNAGGETFSREYVSELRNESKGYRLARDNEKARADAAHAAHEALKADFEKTKTETQKAADARVMRSELKAIAVKHGMVDLDGLQMLDLSKLTLDEKGDVKGAEELMAEARKAKPYLFGSSTSSTSKTPDPNTTPKNARDMTDAEYAAERAKLVEA